MKEEPFGGRVSDGYVWVRGAIDNKSAVVGTLEAVDMLLQEGFRPRRTVLLAFGHDEETGGQRGAAAIAALLRERGIDLELVLDEGGVIGEGLLPGVAGPVALVGVAEKGFATVELTVEVPGGHSSLPPRQSAAGVLSAAITRLEAGQMPARLEGPVRQMFERLAPAFPFPERALFSNLWLGAGLVARRLEGSPTTNAMVRTTTAVTMIHAGTKDNVLPSHARAVVNCRILPGDTVSSVVRHVRRTIDDERIKLKVTGRFTAEPSGASSPESETWRRLERAIVTVTPEARVTPYLVVVATDARHYAGLTANVFRFLPLRLTPSDLARMHGLDERVAIHDYETAVRTYRQVLLEAGS